MERNKKDSRGLKIVEGKMQMKQNIEAPPAVHPMAERSKIKKKKQVVRLDLVAKTCSSQYEQVFITKLKETDFNSFFLENAQK